MGKTLVNGRSVVTPASETAVSELKELADVPPHEKLYTKEGRVLGDSEVVPTDHGAEYGAVTDWVRGG
jgi:hypothetical protein